MPSEKQKKSHERWRKNHKAKHLLMVKRWQANNPGYWVTRYGITKEQYREMIEEQQDKCHLCGVVMTGGKTPNATRRCIDHNHVTGKVRKLLCGACNRKLECVEDSTDTWLTKARSYLNDYN